jgi:hypothetical protein
MIPTIVQKATVLAMLVVALSACTPQWKRPMQSTKYDYDAITNETQAAFRNKQPQVALEAFEEDAAFFRINDEGVKEVITGRENLFKSMQALFGADSQYVGSKATRLALVQNILVMYHEDAYEAPDGTKRVEPRIVLVEHRNGKRWREWEFQPQDR